MAAEGRKPVIQIQFEDYALPAFDQIVNKASKFRYRGRAKGLLLASILESKEPVNFLKPKPPYRVAVEEVPEAAIKAIEREFSGLNIQLIDLRTVYPWDRQSVLGNGEGAFRFEQLLLGLNTNLLKKQACGETKELHEEVRDRKAGQKAWIDTANVCDAVVVCADLGDAITATDAAGPRNGECFRLPQGRDYLAVSVNCLKELVETNGVALHGDIQARLLKISEKSDWNFESDALALAAHNKLKFRSKLSGQEQNGSALPAITISIPAAGAVLFGNLLEEP
ncbi:hypothetical protein BJY01DRAFT_255400 [Aspergillus pseudoustus]|uniref:Uncharacterized protein n=1 Tax=Aspergillus pseudoustus TaxID=1810923 RepID=A0ABR4IKM8_9EURO